MQLNTPAIANTMDDIPMTVDSAYIYCFFLFVVVVAHMS